MEAEALGDVRGQSILHLQCANGNESLSLAASGASVVGVDISDVAIQMARDNAMATGLSARFVAADVYDLPDDLRGFDIVYASAGVVCWLPDLYEWASMISNRLRNGGRFVLYEHHPLWDTLNTTGGTLSVDRSYFGRVVESASTDCHDSRTPLGATPESEFISFVWPIGEVVTALITAGLTLSELAEQPASAMYQELGGTSESLPATFVLQAVKPENTVSRALNLESRDQEIPDRRSTSGECERDNFN